MAEAEKIKKRLNGSILKGSKMSVEEARPEKKLKRVNREEKPDPEVATEKKVRKADKKRKREDGVLPGFELPEKRKVKRGWTEPMVGTKSIKAKKIGKDRETREKAAKLLPSAFTDSRECLFRTKLPPNVSTSTSTTQDKPKKRKVGKSHQEALVHEFSNTTKHAGFLRDTGVASGKQAVSEYLEGRGWLDGDGNVIEQATNSQARKPIAQQASVAKKSYLKVSGNKSVAHASPGEDAEGSRGDTGRAEEPDETSSSGISSSSEDSSGSKADGDAPSEDEKSACPVRTGIPVRTSFSIADPTSDVEDDNVSEPSSSSDEKSESSTKSQIAAQVPPLTITSTQTPSEVHPLEALFKKPRQTPSGTPRKPNLEVQTSFSFFDADTDAGAGNDSLDQTQHAIPQTPFTQRDIQQRRMRSAAPTPDTAAPNKGFGLGFGDADDLASSEDERDQEDRENRDTPLPEEDAKTKDGNDADPPQSDFAKWFWEHRGETNRAWKKRRREVAKEQRQRENKRRARSAI